MNHQLQYEVRQTFPRSREKRDIPQAGATTEEFRDSALVWSRKCWRLPKDEAGQLRPMEIARRHQQMAAPLATSVR